MNTKKEVRLCLVLFFFVVFAGLPTITQAEIFTFFGEDLGLGEDTPLPAWPNALAAQDEFLARLIDPGVENLEVFADGTAAPLAVDFGIAGLATLQGNGEINLVFEGSTNGYGRYATSGTNYWETTDVFYIEFSEPVAAFGFYGVDIGDFSGNVTLELEIISTAGDIMEIVVPNTVDGPGGSVLFFGIIIDDPNQLFSRVEFSNTAPGDDVFAFDDFTIGSLEQVQGGASLDIKPGSCPNSFNPRNKGVLPVALVGSELFDVLEVDLYSVTLSRVDGIGGSVVPNEGPPGPHSIFADVATPFDGELCDCHELEGDGITDISMKFNSPEVTDVLMLDTFTHGDEVELVLSGTLLDSSEFMVSDCIRIVGMKIANPIGLNR